MEVFFIIPSNDKPIELMNVDEVDNIIVEFVDESDEVTDTIDLPVEKYNVIANYGNKHDLTFNEALDHLLHNVRDNLERIRLERNKSVMELLSDIDLISESELYNQHYKDLCFYSIDFDMYLTYLKEHDLNMYNYLINGINKNKKLKTLHHAIFFKHDRGKIFEVSEKRSNIVKTYAKQYLMDQLKLLFINYDYTIDLDETLYY